MQSTRPTTHQTPRTRATRPSSHEWAGSLMARARGRKTDRSPCAIHFSGKIDAAVCIQVGSELNWKNTPEVNCSSSATGVTVADADRPFLARLDSVIPSSVQAVAPSTDTQAKVNHSAPEGRWTL